MSRTRRPARRGPRHSTPVIIIVIAIRVMVFAAVLSLAVTLVRLGYDAEVAASVVAVVVGAAAVSATRLTLLPVSPSRPPSRG